MTSTMTVDTMSDGHMYNVGCVVFAVRLGHTTLNCECRSVHKIMILVFTNCTH